MGNCISSEPLSQKVVDLQYQKKYGNDREVAFANVETDNNFQVSEPIITVCDYHMGQSIQEWTN